MLLSADNTTVKVLVLYKSVDSDIAEQISLICKASISEVTLYPYKSAWRNDLHEKLESHDVAVAVVDRDFFKYAAAVFVSGYATGGKKPLVLFMKEQYRVSGYMKGLPAIRNLRSLTGILQEELAKAERSVLREEAEKKLGSMGVPFTPEAFIDTVREGAIDAVKQFLEAGFSPDLTNERGVPLLCIAARNRHRAVVIQLLQKGADVNAVSKDRGNTALMDAAAEKDSDLVKDLIESGADLNVKNKTGQSALILAAGQKAEDIAVQLIGAGASVEAKDALGMTAEKYAKLYNLSSLLKALEPDP